VVFGNISGHVGGGMGPFGPVGGDPHDGFGGSVGYLDIEQVA
jgi:hypothetical protein